MNGMLVKRLFRMAADIVDILGRGQIVWQILTLTKAGHLVLATAAAATAFVLVLLRSDPLILALTFAVIAFVGIAALASFVFRLNSRPKLEYKGITGIQFEFGDAKFGTEEGGFLWAGGFLRPLLVRIANAQQATDITANNVTALIHYEHHDGRDITTLQAVWAAVGRQGAEFVERIQIESEETAHLVMVYIDPPTPNQEAPGARRTNEFLVTGSLFAGSQFKKLGVGHWNVLIEVRSDNSPPLLLKGGFTVTKDGRIPLDTPALRKLGVWQ